MGHPLRDQTGQAAVGTEVGYIQLEDTGPGSAVGKSHSGMVQGLVGEDNHPAETAADFGLGLAAVIVNECQ